MIYAYKAALLCEDCGYEMCEDLRKQGKLDTEDSNEFPQMVGESEADTPQHCDHCSLFLENDLTTEGYDYLMQTIMDCIVKREFSETVLNWIDFYSIDLQRVIDWVIEEGLK